MIFSGLGRCLGMLLLVLWLTACSQWLPPREFAPNGEVVAKAIALQLRQSQTQLSDQLDRAVPHLEVHQIIVDHIEPVYTENLPTYHLQGTYNLTLGFGKRSQEQKNNPFDLYLQRQKEGKTWRLLRLWVENGVTQWRSYGVW